MKGSQAHLSCKSLANRAYWLEAVNDNRCLDAPGSGFIMQDFHIHQLKSVNTKLITGFSKTE